MRWGMHKWFLLGMFASAVITTLFAIMIESVGLSIAVVVLYLLVSSALLFLYFRRRHVMGTDFRSRELRCKWAKDLSMRARRAPQPAPRRTSALLALD